MNRWLLAAASLLAVSTGAQADEGKYQYIPCRMDDPFVFCTQGCRSMTEPSSAWKPIKGTAGEYTVTPGYCPEYVYYAKGCKDWQPMEVVALNQFKQVCKWPHEAGEWVPENGQGRPEDEPIKH